MIPTHSGLRLISFSEQRLNKFTSRLMVTMEKRWRKSQEEEEEEEKKAEQQHQDSITSESSSMSMSSTNEIDYLNNFREKYFSTKK
jgi:anti-sigma28 factor (negative regulator of flagellin synthesis)